MAEKDEQAVAVKSSYAGSEWIKRALRVEEMSPLGEKVADLLGDVFFGIYHLDNSALRRVEWDNAHHVIFSLGWRTISTIDDDYLTRLVILAHDRMLRLEISAANRHYLRLTFHQRRSRSGELMYRCPTIEDHIASIRSDYS